MDKATLKKTGDMRNPKTDLSVITIVLIAFSLMLVTPSVWAQTEENPHLEKVHLQLKWKHQFQFAGYYIAVEKGYYEEAGLDVEIVEGKPELDFVHEVVSGRAEYGIEMPDLLLHRNHGDPVVVLAAIYQHSPIAIISLADSNIKNPHDLAGRKVMLREASDADLRAMISIIFKCRFWVFDMR